MSEINMDGWIGKLYTVRITPSLYKQLAKQLSAERCACKLLAYRTRLSSRHSAIYSTMTMTYTALDLMGVGSTGRQRLLMN